MKSRYPHDVKKFTDIPNVGPRIANDFKTLNIEKPVDLRGKDAFKLYSMLCKKTKMRQDPCVLDTFIAVVDFMNGADPVPWWKYTKERKQKYPEI